MNCLIIYVTITKSTFFLFYKLPGLDNFILENVKVFTH